MLQISWRQESQWTKSSMIFVMVKSKSLWFISGDSQAILLLHALLEWRHGQPAAGCQVCLRFQESVQCVRNLCLIQWEVLKSVLLKVVMCPLRLTQVHPFINCQKLRKFTSYGLNSAEFRKVLREVQSFAPTTSLRVPFGWTTSSTRRSRAWKQQDNLLLGVNKRNLNK